MKQYATREGHGHSKMIFTMLVQWLMQGGNPQNGNGNVVRLSPVRVTIDVGTCLQSGK
jgi:hypothetical protein